MVPPLLLAFLAAFLWGATDSLMKYVAPPQASSSSLVASLFSLLSCPPYLLLLLANQLGSLLYYLALSSAPLSLLAPATNATKFLVTVVSGRLLGEPRLGQRKCLGLLLLLTGVLLQLTG